MTDKTAAASTAAAPQDPPWWADLQTLAEAHDPARGQGLTAAQAQAQLMRFGPNRFGQQRDKPLVWQYLAHFKNPLVVILLVASGVSALSGDGVNFAIIVCIVLMSVTLDFVQEHRANRAAEKLRQSVMVRATVLRDGKPCECPVSALVPGDVVLLSAGDLTPADGLVLEARDFFVNQALLTGEPYPVEKHPAPPVLAADLQEATHAVFMGTSVISGSARVLLVKTGADTEMGGIADSVSRPAEANSFELGMRRFGMLIMRLTVLLVMFVVLVNGLLHRPLLESFLFAVALAVGLTPELLPMVVSVTLSRGAMRMAAQQIIVKRQTAIQDLGSMDVLCTDKTGTLTEARIRMEKHVDPWGQDSDRALELAYLNSHFESGLKSPLDDAILASGQRDVSAWTKIDEVPFDFERRRVSVLVQRGDERWLVVKGAPDDILALCTYCEGAYPLVPEPFDAAALARARSTYHALEDEGFRILAIAWRRVGLAQAHAQVNDESELVLAGFAAFLDPPKASAARALQALQADGVAIKVVTGDSDRVTRHVCSALKLPVIGVLTGQDIAAMSDEALRASVETTNLFCRVNPAQKNRVIQALRARGHVVGYLGDGVNDAPSLHSADVGLSVDSAVDVAKAAADMILLRQDLNILHEAVLEGRRTFGNIMKYIMMGTSSNFGNMFSMAGAVLFLPFLPMLPTQILLNNILYDISEITIPLDAVDAQETRLPRVMDMALIRKFMFTMGPISSLFDFLTFYVMLQVFHADEKLFQTGWFVESLCTQVLVIFVIRTHGNPLRSRPHPLLTLTSLTVVAVAMALPYTALGAAFGFTPPPAAFYGVLALMVVVYLALVECIKRRLFR
jgi:P-type Mg2+ transporter